MFEQERWPARAWIPIVAGAAWLALSGSFVGFLLAALPGALLLSTGTGTLLHAGDPRLQHFMALGGVVGTLLSVPALFVLGPGSGLLLFAGSAASFVVAGASSVRHEPFTEEVPRPEPSVRLAAEVALDDALLGMMSTAAPMRFTVSATQGEVQKARELYASRGWLEKPVDFHRDPPPLQEPRIARRSAAGLSYEHLSFESGYEPHAEEPGRDRWLAQAANRTAHAWVMRHPEPDRPWLLCTHGYQMGAPRIDFAAFRAARLHRKLGLNLAFPVLPLHGPRKMGRVSGDGFLAGDFLDSIHAEAQAMWDLRQLLGWIRAQGAERVGAYGLSLGGYNTALLACLDSGLACAVAGIPATDIPRLMWRHGPDLQVLYAEQAGLAADDAADVLRVVSPLVLEPKVAHERRYIFGGTSDRLVPPEQVRDLWNHWGRPRMVWYPGAHVTFGLHPQVGRMLDDALRESGLVTAAA